MDSVTAKELGAPIAGEDPGAQVVCPRHGSYGLYAWGVGTDVCRSCERQKAKAGDQQALKRLAQLDRLRQAAQRARDDAAERARRIAERSSKGPHWGWGEPISAKGYLGGGPVAP